MALNGSVSVDVTPNSHDILTFSWEATQDKQARTSTVVWKMELISDASGALNVTDADAYSWTVIIDGQEFSGKSNIHIGANETKTLTSGEVTLTHEEDGTKVFEFTFTQNFGGISWGGSTELCPVCSGTGLDANQSGGISIPCSACNGNGVIGSSSGAIIINDVTGSGVGELDSLIGKFPILDLINGLIMHFCSRFTRYPQVEPIAYLYGEYEHPPLPEWDNEQYPYICFAPFTGGTTGGLFASSTPFVLTSNGYVELEPSVDISALETDDHSKWHEIRPVGSWFVDIVPKWTNHDILNEDGTIYLKASRPLPVYKHTTEICDYNGRMLPALPVWDAEAFPYAYILNTGSVYAPTWKLFVTAEPYYATIYEDTGNLKGIYCDHAILHREYVTSFDKGVWLLDTEYSAKFGHTYIPFWTNTDMKGAVYHSVSGGTSYYTTTDTVVLEKSEPVLMGGITQKYSYNGIVMPKLPEWNITGYPYATISRFELPGKVEYFLQVFAPDAFYFEDNYGRHFGGNTSANVRGIYYTQLLGQVIWDGPDETTSDYISLDEFLVWSNFDVLNSDGSIFLAASEPVLVHE